MKRCAWFLIVLMLAAPAWAARSVTVAQLEQLLQAAQNKPAATLADQLANLELTERLSPDRLAHWKAVFLDDQTQRELTALADQSQFLDPPASEIPPTAAPDNAAQRRIMTLVVAYVLKAIPQLPNIFANQQSAFYQEIPKSFSEGVFTKYQPLHFIRSSNWIVRYNIGQEVLEEVSADEKKTTLNQNELTTRGIFGPILATVLMDAAQNKLVWGHWEQGASGMLAVFNYSVLKEKSHYPVDYCCVVDPYGASKRFHQLVGYHGQMAVDPATGSILRLTLEAELKENDPVSRAAIMVDYAPVEIGGKSYICPSKSVSLSRAQTTQLLHDGDRPAVIAGGRMTASVATTQGASSVVAGPQRMLLNDAVYNNYHIFRAEGRILADNVEVGNSAPAGSSPANSAANNPAAGTANTIVAETSAPAPSAQTLPAPSAASAPSSTPVPAPAPAADSEINTTEVNNPPDSAADASLPQPVAFTLKSVARLVDVGVVAYDKKGHPIRDLKQDDFEVYDNGVKQDIRFFSQSAEEPVAAPGPSPLQPAQSEFSNHGSSDQKTGVGPESSSTILLIDAGNLAFNDLSYARAETLRFLQALPAGERVGLYILKSYGFQILAEETTDHAQLEEKLSRWMPNASDMARAQDAEQRNRQQFDEVHSIEDMLYVNGNTSNDPEGHTQTLDPALRDWGSNPGRDAMFIMVGVARHLAAIPGHKNLVWISSDNALVDWSNQAVSIEKGDKHIEPNTLRAQEAMNDAHVSVYPLDASQLDGGSVDPGIYSNNVQMSPVAPLRTQGSSLGPEASAGADIDTQGAGHDLRPGRLSAQMQQDMRPIQGPVRHLADATGGRIFRRSGGISGELSGVVADGHSAYQLSFYPQTPADGNFHTITVKLATRQKGVTLHYRTGYLYAMEPTTLKQRFQQAVWLPADSNQIAVTVQPASQKDGLSLKITVAGGDLALQQKSGRWSDNLDVFFIQRDDAALHAQMDGKRLGLQLKDASVKGIVANGLTFEHTLQLKPSITALRILLVDENSGRMGSVTIPAASLPASD